MPVAPPPLPPGYAVARTLDLQKPLKLAEPLTATVEVPNGPDAATGALPVRVCFTTAATAQAARCEEVRRNGYGAQTLVSATVETLSQPQHARALVVAADFSGGADTLRVVTAWSCSAGGCSKSFSDDFTDVGDGEVFASGPFAGYYIHVDFVTTQPDETRWDPHRFSVSVYRLDPRDDGYLQVLQYVTAGRYPAERTRDHEQIDGELPRIGRLLKAIYPAGPPS